MYFSSKSLDLRRPISPEIEDPGHTCQYPENVLYSLLFTILLQHYYSSTIAEVLVIKGSDCVLVLVKLESQIFRRFVLRCWKVKLGFSFTMLILTMSTESVENLLISHDVFPAVIWWGFALIYVVDAKQVSSERNVCTCISIACLCFS